MFEELFSFACPKFLSPVVPNYDNVNPNYHKEPFQQQLKVFAEEVQQQAQLSTIRRYHSSIHVEGTSVSFDEEQQLYDV